jgi:signal transduction histidine kinase
MSPRVRPKHGFVALGVVCTAVGVQHLLFEGEGLGTLIESFIILSLASVIFYTAVELPSRDISETGRWEALELSVSTAVAFAALAVAVWVTWWVEGDPTELSFLLSFAFTLGALVGARGGLYSVEAGERLAEAEELTKLLSINQRVLRHNIRNELSIALGYLDLLERDADAAGAAENARIIRAHLNQLLETSDRTRRIISVWRTEGTRRFDLVSLVDELLADLAEETEGVPITTSLPDTCRVRAHPALPLALEEAIRNAIEHNESDVAVTIGVDRLDEKTVRVFVADTGCGIPKQERDILGGAGETPLEHMEGVGLWLIYWIVTQSGGSVDIVGNDDGGTTVRIDLPVQGVPRRARPGRR